MIKKIFLSVILLVLAYAFWNSPTFKEVAAGVAILLIGMIMLEEGFKAFAQGPLEKLIRKTTDKLYKSLGIGFFTTALLQSSSLISVVVISFISAGLMSLQSGIGVIFGANIGTTATAWLIAGFGLKIKIAALSMPMLVFGVLLIFQKKYNLKALGKILTGLGLFFLGVHFMKEGFDSYKDTINLAAYAMPGFWGLIVYTGIGILITLILQSSSATLALILTALAAGQVSYENTLALAIGANVGTTITAVLGALGANVDGRRLAGAHFIFNITTGIIALVFIHQLSALVNYLATGFGIAAANYTLKLSLFHTIFNLIGVIVMVPFINPMVKWLNRIFKEKSEEGVEHTKYLNDAVLEFPSSAITALLKESKRLFEGSAFEIVAHALSLHREDIKSTQKPKELVKASNTIIEIDINDLYYSKVKLIYSRIIEFGTRIQGLFSMSSDSAEMINKIKVANRHIVEAIKDARDLQQNVNKFMMSDNKYIRNEYNDLRKKVTKVLREVHLTSIDSDPATHLESLNRLLEKVKKSDVLVDGSLDKLIREGFIASQMATSLANDSSYVADICKNLINAAKLLYVESDSLIEGLTDEDQKEESVKAHL
ncbi:MAG: phosphate:Na+ symporter [Saprospiraceae bacterium]|jgi:phosphate:Na+ symporter